MYELSKKVKVIQFKYMIFTFNYDLHWKKYIHVFSHYIKLNCIELHKLLNYYCICTFFSCATNTIK